jgi:hypothetical protein
VPSLSNPSSARCSFFLCSTDFYEQLSNILDIYEHFGLMVRAYLKGLTLPKDLWQRGTFGGPLKKKKTFMSNWLEHPALPGIE